MPAWGWLATWLVGMSGLVLLASEAVVPRVQARERGADQRLLEELHGTVASIITRPITLTVVERRVSLEGEVSSAAEREALLDATREHEGVAGVDDALSVAQPEDAAAPEAPALSDASPATPEPAPPPAPDPAPAPLASVPDAPPAPDDVAEPDGFDDFTAPDAFAGPDDPVGSDGLDGTDEPVRFTVIDEFGDELLEDEEALALGAPPPDGPIEPEPRPGAGAQDVRDATPAAAPLNDATPDDPFAPATSPAPPPAPPAPEVAGTPLAAGDAGAAPGPIPTEPAPSNRPATLTLRVVGDALRFVGDIAADDERRLADVVGPATEAFDPSYVENTVQTDTDIAPARWLAPLEALLVPLAGLEEPAVTVDADRLFVAGSAPDVTSRDAVLDAVARLFPDHALEDRLTLGGAAAGAVRRAPDPATPLREDEADGDAGARREALSAAFLALPDRNVLFESGTADFAADSEAKLERIARLLDEHPGVRVEIEGHTDALGPARDNLALSQRRANAVRDALVAAGVERGRLVAYGYGEGVPIAENATPEGRARNRRIEFRF